MSVSSIEIEQKRKEELEKIVNQLKRLEVVSHPVSREVYESSKSKLLEMNYYILSVAPRLELAFDQDKPFDWFNMDIIDQGERLTDLQISLLNRGISGSVGLFPAETIRAVDTTYMEINNKAFFTRWVRAIDLMEGPALATVGRLTRSSQLEIISCHTKESEYIGIFRAVLLPFPERD